MYLAHHLIVPSGQIQLKSLAEEMQAISKGLEILKQELTASESDVPLSEVFRKVSCCYFLLLYSTNFDQIMNFLSFFFPS